MFVSRCFSEVRTRDSRERSRILGRPCWTVNRRGTRRPARGTPTGWGDRTPDPHRRVPAGLPNPSIRCRCGCEGTRLRSSTLPPTPPTVRTCVTGIASAIARTAREGRITPVPGYGAPHHAGRLRSPPAATPRAGGRRPGRGSGPGRVQVFAGRPAVGAGDAGADDDGVPPIGRRSRRARHLGVLCQTLGSGFSVWPSSVSTCPEMRAPPGEARNSAIAATSSAVTKVRSEVPAS